MKVYDFDGTVYKGNSVWEFYWFCIIRHPSILRCLPRQLWAMLCYWFGASTKTAFWQAFYMHFRHLPDVDRLANEFWNEKRLRKLSRTYLEVRHQEDLILSATPECLLEPVCKALGVAYMGSLVDPKTGTCTWLACGGTEKLHRFRDHFPQGRIEVFWSARFSDLPVAQIAKKRCIVRGNRVADWDEVLRREGPWREQLRKWVSPEFFRFWCVGWLNMAAAWLLEAVWSLVFAPNLAFAVGYSMSLMVSFSLNSKITFRTQISLHRFWKYVLSYIPNFVVQYLTVLLFHNLLHWPHLLTYFIAAVVGTPVTFFCLKYFAYHKRET